MGTICPCCGQKTDALPIETMVQVLSDKAAEIVVFLAKHPGQYVGSAAIARYIYRMDPEGGPLNAPACINQIIGYNRRKMAAMGWEVQSRMGVDGGYRLNVSEAARPEGEGK